MIRLIMYDIEDDNLRQKLAKRLNIFGLKRIQKSVFCGRLSQTQWTQCEHEILDLLGDRELEDDKIFWISISKKQLSEMKIIGQFQEQNSILEPQIVLYI